MNSKIFHNSFWKKPIAALAIIGVFIPAVAGFSLPRKAEAQWAVIDAANLAANSAAATSLAVLAGKETVGDSLAWIAAKIAIQHLTRATVRWINNGFEGSPAFVQNPEQFFYNLGDITAGEFILRNPDLEFLCSPFGFDVRIAVLNSYQQPFADNVRCTLTEVIDNIEGFTNDMRTGDWIAWNAMTQNRANNPYGAFIEVQSELQRRSASRQASYQQQLNWGRGFISWEDENGNTQTPGSVIQDQLALQLGSRVRQLELADEINEIVAALLGQLVTQVFGGNGGLRNVDTNVAIPNAPGGGACVPPETPPATPTAPLPDGSDIVDAVAAEHPDWLQNSCQDAGGTWQFMDEVVSRLRAEDPNWGYNGKRGNAGDPSHDAISYKWGADDEVYVIDIIGGHCGASPTTSWLDQTAATYGCGTTGLWLPNR